MNVSAIIVTRGDVDIDPIIESWPREWERVVWDNGHGQLDVWAAEDSGVPEYLDVPDLSVYGRYAAIEHASHDLIYVQDDDVIVSDPQAIVDEYIDEGTHMNDEFGKGLTTYFEDPGCIVANMPPEFRHSGYTDSCLVGFGACFHRSLPNIAFALMIGAEDTEPPFFTEGWGDVFGRTCDVVFTTLTPRVLVDVPKTNLPWAEDYSRMYRQPNHTTERMQMLELARRVRDAQ